MTESLDAAGSTSTVSASSELLVVDSLTVEFPTDDGVVQAVRGVSYQVAPGEVLGIVGESGSGKAVASRAVKGPQPKTANIKGSGRFRGQEVPPQSENRLRRIRGDKIAMLSQDPPTPRNPAYSTRSQVAEAVPAHPPDVHR